MKPFFIAAIFSTLLLSQASIVQIGEAYDFYEPNGTRIHYGQSDTRGPRLGYIEDPNGNRVAFTYELNQGAPRVSRIEDSAGRSIDLTYAVKSVETQASGYTFSESFTVVTDARGPEGVLIHYDYDTAGNLIKVTRSDGSGVGTSVQGYSYTDLGSHAVGL